MNINDLTIGQAKELASMFGGIAPVENKAQFPMIGKKVIVRTYSAGNWFATLEQKCGTEVILSNARRMYRWWCAEGISLSCVAIHGIKQDKSKIVEAVESVWLDAIEIIPCEDKAIKSIEGAENVKAE